MVKTALPILRQPIQLTLRNFYSSLLVTIAVSILCLRHQWGMKATREGGEIEFVNIRLLKFVKFFNRRKRVQKVRLAILKTKNFNCKKLIKNNLHSDIKFSGMPSLFWSPKSKIASSLCAKAVRLGNLIVDLTLPTYLPT